MLLKAVTILISHILLCKTQILCVVIQLPKSCCNSKLNTRLMEFIIVWWDISWELNFALLSKNLNSLLLLLLLLLLFLLLLLLLLLFFNCISFLWFLCSGDLLIIMAQIIAATQMVVEEKFLKQHDIPPLQAVGWEGELSCLFQYETSFYKMK